MTDTKPMGIPFHLRERSVEGALLSCWLYCVDIVFVCLFSVLLVCASGRARRFVFFVFSFVCLCVWLGCSVCVFLHVSSSSSPVVGLPLVGCFLTCSWCDSVCCRHELRELFTSDGRYLVCLRPCPVPFALSWFSLRFILFLAYSQ